MAEFEELKRLPFIIDQLEAIQEPHSRQLIHLPSWDPSGHAEYRESTQCKTCGSAENPYATRRLADDALGGGQDA